MDLQIEKRKYLRLRALTISFPFARNCRWPGDNYVSTLAYQFGITYKNWTFNSNDETEIPFTMTDADRSMLSEYVTSNAIKLKVSFFH